MDVQTLTYLVIGITFAVYIGIAIKTRAGSTKEFYVAGGGVPPILNGMATAADWMSAASFISLAGIVSFVGYDGSVYLMGWTGGYVLLALLMVPYLRKFGKFTVPDFIGDRYYSQTARTVAVICAIFISFTYIAGQMRGVGVVFSRFLEVEVDTGVYIGMCVVFFYAVLGGMKGITYTQVAQYVVMIFAFMVPAIFLSVMMTGHVFPQLGFGAEVLDATGNSSGVYLLDKLDGLSTELGFAQYTEGAKSMIDVFFICGALMFGTAGLPHVIVRFFTVPSVKASRSSAGWTLLFIAIMYTTIPALAAFSRVNMIESINGADGKGIPHEQAPNWVNSWEKTGLIQWEDKNSDGKMQYTKGAENEMKIDRDIIVLATPEMANLPAWVIALMAAGGLAAALSTSAGLLLVISTSVSHDLLKKNLMPNISDKKELMYARIASGAGVVMAGYFGINPPGFVAAVVAIAFGLAASSLFPAITMGIFSKKMNKEGAIAGMLAGLLFTTVYIAYFKFINPSANNADNWLFGISPEGIGMLGMCINFAVAAAVCKVTAATPQSVVDMVESIRFPKGAGEAQDH
ncbi:sodium:solute symporter family protein [Psychromonas sp. Urea-02u-13]|uniref:sodium:solute symporter family protein n=1 Tax=Psychromonas sp. Urea-02u-13 TaxID=2058326 RepID=UPI000C337686|nr:sodium:solute symporter family protein [Psychromonas sp. Urea-02u-13]PKG40623.1 cation acetate symporter [Psychromonas sp. Urea-02u-13]